MAINLREEKTITSLITRFSEQAGQILAGENGTRKRLALIKTLVLTLSHTIDHARHCPLPLPQYFAESAFPRQPIIAESIGYDAPLELIRNAIHALQTSIAKSTTEKTDIIELYNIILLALQVEAVRLSQKLSDEESDNTNYIKQGQQIEGDDSASTEEDEKEHAPLKRSHLEKTEKPEEAAEQFKRTLESFSASLKQSRQEQQPVTPEEQRKDIKEIIEERKQQNLPDNSGSPPGGRGR